MEKNPPGSPEVTARKVANLAYNTSKGVLPKRSLRLLFKNNLSSGTVQTPILCVIFERYSD
eukprot:569181-Amphidinium_carterae.1